MKIKYTINEVIDTLKEKNIERDNYCLLYEGFDTQINERGYLQFRLTVKDKWKNVHSLVNQYFNSKEHDKKFMELVETGVEKYLITHHNEYWMGESNKLNNHPDNLQWFGQKEHINFHRLTMSGLECWKDKMWNPENPEYKNYETQRENFRKMGRENISNYNEHNKNNEKYHYFRQIVGSEVMNERWHGKNSEEYREKMLPILVENGRKGMNKLWTDENSESFRQEKKEQFLDLWYGEDNEKFREGISKRIKKTAFEFWHGDGNEERRGNHNKRMKIQNSDPKIRKKMVEGRVFTIFNKIIENNEEITMESFFKHKHYKGAPNPEKIFNSIENAIIKYEIWKKI